MLYSSMLFEKTAEDLEYLEKMAAVGEHYADLLLDAYNDGARLSRDEMGFLKTAVDAKQLFTAANKSLHARNRAALRDFDINGNMLGRAWDRYRHATEITHNPHGHAKVIAKEYLNKTLTRPFFK